MYMYKDMVNETVIKIISSPLAEEPPSSEITPDLFYISVIRKE